jgi:hypothetical protein
MQMRSTKQEDHREIWQRHRMSRREFLRHFGIASSAITFSAFFMDRFAAVSEAAVQLTRVYKVKNGDCFQNTAKLWEMLDGPAKYIGANDIVVIKCNAQWPNQGYTHTGCIKGVIDTILQIPNFSGQILICDNTTNGGSAGGWGFDATVSNRVHNWPDHNWNTLAAAYQAAGKPVATKKWTQGPWRNISFPSFSEWNPANGEGWSRSFFTHNGRSTYLSYPVFESPLTSGLMIDMKNGAWKNGVYTGQRVKTIFMPTLNNHGSGSEDYAGITSAVKSFFGATEIHVGDDATFNGYYHIHSSSYTQYSALTAGELVGRYINTMYSPTLFITAAMWSGWQSRVGSAAETKTVLACSNPVSLDYIASRDVISPYASWLNPDNNNNTRKQLLGCSSQGIGTLDSQNIEVLAYDFSNPGANRLDVERKIRNFKSGTASEQEVKDTINLYMDSQ